MKVYVTWDSVVEEIVCVHTSEAGVCDKCFDPKDKNKKWGKYNVECHEVEEDK